MMRICLWLCDDVRSHFSQRSKSSRRYMSILSSTWTKAHTLSNLKTLLQTLFTASFSLKKLTQCGAQWDGEKYVKEEELPNQPPWRNYLHSQPGPCPSCWQPESPPSSQSTALLDGRWSRSSDNTVSQTQQGWAHASSTHKESVLLRIWQRSA